MDWLSSFLDLAPVRGRLDLRCHYGAPWRIDQARAGVGEIAYHVVLAGSVTVAGVNGRPAQHLAAGDILLLLDGNAHTLHDGSGATAVPAQSRPGLNLTITENAGTGERLDMLCGHFIVTSPHLRLLRAYLPPRLVIRTGPGSPQAVGSAARGQLSDLVELMRRETDTDGLGGRAMLNAFSAALFALALRFVAEAGQAPSGLLALAGSPRLAPAVTAMFLKPGHPWTLPELAGLCSMSRATFARHFQRALGGSAADVLLDIRMAVASEALKQSGASISAIAAAAGYQSEAAFQRIFKRRVGSTPAQWRRASDEDRQWPHEPKEKNSLPHPDM